MPGERLQGWLSLLLLAACLLLGGGQGTLGDTFCQCLALVLAGLVLWRHLHEPEARLPRLAWLAAVPFALPLLQLLPLPGFLWNWPEAREPLREALAAAGTTPGAAWSLNPTASERAGLWLLPAAAMFLSVLGLGVRWRRYLLYVLVAVAVASVLLGMAQLAGGKDSPLRFYAITNVTEAVGLFANRNHFAGLLALCLPLVIAGLALAVHRHPHEETGRRLLRLLAGTGLVALLVLGIALARSRAGLLLGMLGILLSLPAVLGLRSGQGSLPRWLIAGLGLGLVLAVQFALFGILQRLEKDPFEDARFRYAGIVAELAGEHAPLGTGLGGFRRAFEASDPDPGSAYINQAHNDWAQLWLEGGWPGLLLAAAALAALAVAGWRVWRRRAEGHGPQASLLLRRVSWISLLLVSLHSLADYPLRTSAHLATFGLLAACVTAPRLRTVSDTNGEYALHAA